MGPYRVWLSYAWVPGLAMSRALGDHLAHTVRHSGRQPPSGRHAMQAEQTATALPAAPQRSRACCRGHGCHAHMLPYPSASPSHHPHPPHAATRATRAQVGVTSEPEHVSVTLCADDRFLVLASDGVWEFISSQEAVDMVAAAGSVEDACRAVRHGAPRPPAQRGWGWGWVGHSGLEHSTAAVLHPRPAHTPRRCCAQLTQHPPPCPRGPAARSWWTRPISAGWWRRRVWSMTSPPWWSSCNTAPPARATARAVLPLRPPSPLAARWRCHRRLPRTSRHACRLSRKGSGSRPFYPRSLAVRVSRSRLPPGAPRPAYDSPPWLPLAQHLLTNPGHATQHRRAYRAGAPPQAVACVNPPAAAPPVPAGHHFVRGSAAPGPFDLLAA